MDVAGNGRNHCALMNTIPASLPSSATNGLIAASVTAFHSDGSLNLDFVAPMADFLSRRGVVGVFVNGTTGEAPSLSIEEREKQAEAWRVALPAGMKMFVHLGACALPDARRLAKHAASIGADAVAAMPPGFFRPAGVREVVSWCAEIASVVPDLPFYYYHIPVMNGVQLRVRNFLEEASSIIPNLAGVKYTFEGLDDFLLCREFEGGRFDMLWGRDEMLLAALAVGATSAVGSTYNIASPLYNKIIEAFQCGDLSLARKMQADSCRLIVQMQKTGSFFSALKHLLAMQGLPILPLVRNPLPQVAVKAIPGIEQFSEYLQAD